MLVKVRDKVRAGVHGWNMYYNRIILLEFIHNPARSISRRSPFAFLRNAVGLDQSKLY